MFLSLAVSLLLQGQNSISPAIWFALAVDATRPTSAKLFATAELYSVSTWVPLLSQEPP